MLRKLLLPLIVVMAVEAGATPVFWTVNGTMVGGGAITGSFTFDADTTSYSGINITTTAGTFIGANYLVQQPEFAATATGFTSAPALLGNYTGTPILFLVFPALTNAGGVVNLNTGSSAEGQCTAPACSGNNFVLRFLSGGTVTSGAPPAVPEPSTLGLIGLGLTAIAVWRRRV